VFSLSRTLNKDHCKGVEALARAACDIYMLQETKEALNLSGHRIHVIEPLKQFNVGTFQVLPFPLKHDVPNIGFLLSSGGYKAVYITDTPYCPYRFSGLNLVAIECNYSDDVLRENVRAGKLSAAQRKRILHSHFGLENLMLFFEANGFRSLKEIHLLHLSNRNANALEIKRKISGVTGVPVYVADE